MSLKFHTLSVKHIQKETDDSVSITFDVPSELMNTYSFKSGQYITLKTLLNGEEVRRSYSICSAPSENILKVGVKKIEGGLFSTFANDTLKIGDTLDVFPPTGNFILNSEEKNQSNYLLIAAGSGITPILSLCKTILQQEKKDLVTLIFGNKTASSIMFKEEIEALKNTYLDRLTIIHILSRENLGNTLQKGRIDADKLNQLNQTLLKNNTFNHVYVCGPESIVHDVKEFYSDQSETKVHFELFGTPVNTNTDKKTEKTLNNVDAFVKVIIDGDTIEFPMEANGPSILDVAYSNGADLPFACKGGVCCTCKAKIISGTAEMTVNYALEKDEVEAGYILTCQAHPTSDQLVVSFDD